MKITQLFIFALTAATFAKAQAQEPKSFGKKTVFCGSSEYEELLQKRFPKRAGTAEFEAWLAPKAEAVKRERQRRGPNAVLTIPVVVHVIHNGDAIGANENISDAQVISQITVLNQDYRRMADTPGFNENPVGADTEIEFCLAQRDPNGLATTGIVRHNLSNSTWDMDDIESELKPQTQWDPNLYLNLWVVSDITINIFGMSMPGIKGYAQFPSASGLEGLEGEQDIANLSGVVIGHKYFGSPEVYADGTYDSEDVRGRTASHEIGHFLGLRHIWGDGDCTMDDFCVDTPEAAEATEGTCPSGVDSCPDNPGVDMVENYMDYSSEGCMNIFTQDQRDRMVAVLQNSPRRASLTSSEACSAAEEHDNDGSLQIQEVEITGCSNTFAPVLKLFNSGLEDLESAIIKYSVDNGNELTYNWSGSLEHGEEAVINLPSLSAMPGGHELNTSLTSVNGAADAYIFNNVRAYAFTIAANLDITEVTIEVKQDAFGSETTWELTDDEGTVVASGGPYEDIMDPQSEMPLHTETVALATGYCYTFTIEDEGDNGLVGIFGQGHFALTSGNTLIGNGGMFGDSDSVSFGVNLILGNGQNLFMETIMLYPVPSKDVINIVTPDNGGFENYTIYNVLGEQVSSGKITSPSQSVDVSNFSEGTYYLRVAGKEYQKTLPFIKKQN